MTKIRLARVGSTHQPYYRIVVTDSRNRRDGRFIEILGSYNPQTNPSTIVINQERASYWVSVGAQATNTTISLLSRAGVKHPFQVRKKPIKPKEEQAIDTTASREGIEAETAGKEEIATTEESEANESEAVEATESAPTAETAE